MGHYGALGADQPCFNLVVQYRERCGEDMTQRKWDRHLHVHAAECVYVIASPQRPLDVNAERFPMARLPSDMLRIYQLLQQRAAWRGRLLRG